MIGDLIPGSLDLIENIAKSKDIYLLSNSNPIHMAKFREAIQPYMNIKAFNKLFKGAYYSTRLGGENQS